MKLITEIEYFTRWGEEILLRINDRLIHSEYRSDGIWTSEVDGLKPGQTVEYRYEVHSGGLCRRSEWASHTVTMPAGRSSKAITVRDSWHDVPAGLPLHSAPFAKGVFSMVPGRQWKAAGVAVPVFSLRSESGFGIGEFKDLDLLVDWAAATGQKIIQLLPIYDTTMTWTWEDSYPYNANSIFALHPQFIHLPDAGVEEDGEYLRLRSELNALDKVDYEKVNIEKHRLLRKAFAKTGKNVARRKSYKDFVEKNAFWLIPYSVYCSLRDEFGTAEFGKWGEYSIYSPEKALEYRNSHKAETDYWCFVQYHLHLQLCAARDYAHSKGVIFKGDLPIGVSRTSVDAWTDSKLFRMDSQAGAPPDGFSAEGQKWGLPTYNWDEMAKDGYLWWRQRLGKMSEYFDALRIDHILGFFRIWEIPLSAKTGLMGHFNPALPYSSDELRNMGFDMSCGRYSSSDENEEDVLFIEDPHRKGFWHPRIAAQYTRSYSMLDDWHRNVYNRLYDDFFYHRHNAFWKESAMRRLSSLLSSTGILVCGEDLGMIPACVSEVIDEYQILSLEIQRMSKNPQVRFADPHTYPYYSVCMVSTHDMNPLRAWWEEDRSVTQAFWNEYMHRGGQAPEVCEPWICREIIGTHLHSSSMLTILLLQDWMSIDPELRLQSPEDERINVPAIPRYYWRYRMPVTLETLLAKADFNALMKDMISGSGR